MHQAKVVMAAELLMMEYDLDVDLITARCTSGLLCMGLYDSIVWACE